MTQELSEEELRQYLAQLREAPVTELVAQAYTMIGAWAEAKLGRRDARTLIDALSGLVQGAAPSLEGDLASRMRDGVTQLQMAQVQLEQQAQRSGGETQGQPEPATAGASEAPSPRSEPPRQQPPRQQPPQPERPMTDRLWIPGRDPRPPSR